MPRVFLLILLFSLPAQAAPRWAAYYTDAAPVQAFLPYDLLVFDSAAHPPLAPLAERGKTLLGYLSIGEVAPYRPYFAELRGSRMMAQEYNWPGHVVVDIRNPAWTARVVEELVPQLLHAGFTGVFLDTVESPLHLEESDSSHPGMREAAVALVKTLRLHYPDMPILLNRGFTILPEVAGDITGFLAESIYSDGAGTPKLFPESVYAYHVKLLHEAQAAHPQLTVYTLDYWDKNDAPGIRAIYAAQRANGFLPYVATPDLQQLVAEPQ